MESIKIKNKYIIKSLAPWMIDELIAFSEITKYDIIFLRKQSDFHKEGLKELEENGVRLIVAPIGINNIFKKLYISIFFLVSNLDKFSLDYNGVIAIKSLWWFLKLDLSHFNENSNIHAQFATQASIVGVLIKKYYNNKPIFSFTFHAYDIYFNNKWFTYLVNKSHKAFSISKYNIEYVANKYIKSEKIILSRLGVNRDLISPIEENQNQKGNIFYIGLISWFVEKKGIIFLLETMNQLKQKGIDNIKLIVAGDGPLKSDFIEFIQNNKLEESVEFIGKVKGESKDAFFRRLDAFVLPSISLKNDQDGIPVVLMEAVAYGLPIISTDVSGIPEICIDKYNGFLIPEKKSTDLHNAIRKLIESKKLCNQFSVNSLEMSLNYDIVINTKMKSVQLGW